MTHADSPTSQHEPSRTAVATGRADPSEAPPGRWSRRTRGLLAVSALYLAIILVLPANLFWSPDEGAKFLQLASYRGHWPKMEQRLQYGGRPSDPKFQFYPQPLPSGHRFELVSQLFPRPAPDGGVQVNWSPLFVLLSMPLFWAFGFHGLYLLPAAAGIGSALLAGTLARRVAPRAELATVLAVGLCTPVLIYSCLFWEHTIAVCLGLAALVLCTREPALSFGRAAAAAACLAVAIVLRPELVVFAAALAVSIGVTVARLRKATAGAVPLRAPAVAVVALSLVAAATAIVATAVVARKLELAAVLGDKEGSLAELLIGLLGSPGFWRELPDRLQRALIDLPADNGPIIDPWIAWLGLVGVLVAVASIALREPARGWTLAAGGGVVTLVSLWVVVSPDRFRSVHALVLPAPYAVFAVLLAYLPPRVGGRARSILTSTTVLVVASTVVLSLPLLVGGLEWGNRYQLIAYVLCAIGCTSGLAGYASSEDSRGPRAVVAVTAVVALAVGGLYQVRGLRELAVTKADLREYRSLITTASRPVVTDLYWLPSALADSFRRVPIFTLRDPDDLGAWIDRVGRGERRFVVVTDEDPSSAEPRWIAGAAPHRVVVIRTQSVGGLWFLDLRRSGEHSEAG